MQADPSPRVVATESAIAEIRRLRAEHGPLMFFQSGGCCDGSSPMCFPDGELLLGPNDLLLGEVDGCPFHIDAEQYERWNRPASCSTSPWAPAPGFRSKATRRLHFVLSSTPTAPSTRRRRAPAPAPTAAPPRPAQARTRGLPRRLRRLLLQRDPPAPIAASAAPSPSASLDKRLR